MAEGAADRLKALRRIEAVQGQMQRLAQARLAQAERQASDLASQAERLRGYLAGSPCDGSEGAAGEAAALPASPLDAVLGSSLSRAALRSLGLVDRASGEARREVDARRAALDALHRRGGAIEAARERATARARRADEARDLAATMEAWLAAGRE